MGKLGCVLLLCLIDGLEAVLWHTPLEWRKPDLAIVLFWDIPTNANDAPTPFDGQHEIHIIESELKGGMAVIDLLFERWEETSLNRVDVLPDSHVRFQSLECRRRGAIG